MVGEGETGGKRNDCIEFPNSLYSGSNLPDS